MPSETPYNEAAWITSVGATPLVVKSAPYTSPKENEIIVKNGAVAINPVDWAIQAMGSLSFSQSEFLSKLFYCSAEFQTSPRQLEKLFPFSDALGVVDFQ